MKPIHNSRVLKLRSWLENIARILDQSAEQYKDNAALYDEFAKLSVGIKQKLEEDSKVILPAVDAAHDLERVNQLMKGLSATADGVEMATVVMAALGLAYNVFATTGKSHEEAIDLMHEAFDEFARMYDADEDGTLPKVGHH